MKAAYYRLRCFAEHEPEGPVKVAAFIMYGRDEAALDKSAERQFDRYAAASGPKTKEERIGPYLVESVAALWGGDEDVDWRKVARAVAMEAASELRTRASCVFRCRMKAENMEGKILTD